MLCLDCNGAAQDCLASLRSMQFRLDLLAQQLPTMEEVQLGQALVEIWKDQYQKLHTGLRNSNLQAKANIKKAALEEDKSWHDIAALLHVSITKDDSRSLLSSARVRRDPSSLTSVHSALPIDEGDDIKCAGSFLTGGAR